MDMHVGDAGASVSPPPWDKAPCRGSRTSSTNAAIGDAGLVALAPALRGCPRCVSRSLWQPDRRREPPALVAPPPPAGAPPPTTGGLAAQLLFSDTQITDAGCATLAAALNSGALPALEELYLPDSFHVSAAAKALFMRRANRRLVVRGVRGVQSGRERHQPDIRVG